MTIENPDSKNKIPIKTSRRFNRSQSGPITLDNIALYFRDISATPLLTSDEERELTTTMANGRTFDGKRKSLDTMHLTPEAAEANAILITSNLLLVVSRAKRKQGRGIPFIDLINTGNIGLMKGIAKFEPERGFKLSTCCTWWIDQSMDREIMNSSRTIRIPVHFHEWIIRIRKGENILYQKLGRKPTVEELAESVGIDPMYMVEAMNVVMKPASFNDPIDREDPKSEELGDRLYEEAPLFEEGTIINEARERVRDAYLSITDERDRAIIGLRYGFIDGNNHTLDEVGKALGISRERVRQVEVKVKEYLSAYFMRNRITKEDRYDY